MPGSTKKDPRGGARYKRADSKFHNHKVCSACKKKKKLAEFPKAGRAGDHAKKAADPTKYSSQCKECKAAKAVDVYQTRKKRGTLPKRKRTDQTRKTARDYRKKIKRQTRIKVFEYLAEKGCCKCGCRDPRVLEFDHKDSSKKTAHIATLVKDGFSWGSNRLRDEILKCRVICANCHRLHTIAQQGYYKDRAVKRRLNELLDEHGITR